MKKYLLSLGAAALVSLAGFAPLGVSFAGFFSSSLYAASCCGGGGGGALILPKFRNYMLDLSLSQENYHGFWDGAGIVRPDPVGSDLSQARLGYGLAKRLSANWQASVTNSFVMNNNSYAGGTTKTNGLGDTTLAFTYENFDNITCVNEIINPEDWLPSSYFGVALTLPTGISPYNDVASSFDITGRGFYRLDFSATVEKTVYPWSVGLSAGYGMHLSRMVNKDYGVYVLPYRKQLGDRRNLGLNIGYTWFTDDLDQVVLTYSYASLAEGQTQINSVKDSTTGMLRRGQKLLLSFQTMDQGWIVKLGYDQAISAYGEGRNFPITKTLSLGVSHVFD